MSLRHALALRAAAQPLAPAGLRACRWHSAGSHSSHHSSGEWAGARAALAHDLQPVPCPLAAAAAAPDSIVQIFGMPSFATEQDVRGMITKLKVQVQEVVPTFSDAGQPRTSWFVRCSNDNGQLSRSRSLNLGKIQVVAKRVRLGSVGARAARSASHPAVCRSPRPTWPQRRKRFRRLCETTGVWFACAARTCSFRSPPCTASSRTSSWTLRRPRSSSTGAIARVGPAPASPCGSVALARP